VQNFAFKFQAVAEKTAKNVTGLLYFAAPCRWICHLLSNLLKHTPCENWVFMFKSTVQYCTVQRHIY